MKLELTQWDRYYPDIGNNRALPEGGRVWLEVERGLSTRQREGFKKALVEVFGTVSEEGFTHRLAGLLSTHLRFGTEPLRHEDGEVTTLEGYVELVFNNRSNRRYTSELLGLVGKANSFDAEAASFFERPSGTAPGTSDGLSPATV
jgi:hypothetical protein